MAFTICTIGCGSIATRAHGPSIRTYAASRDGVSLAACCDLDAARASAFRDAFGFAAAYGDVAQMLAAERPDAVTVVVQPERIAEVASLVLSRGYPALLEKPPGISSAELESIIAAAAGGNTAGAVAFNRRYMPVVREAMRRLAGARVDYVRYEFYRYGRREPGFLKDTGIHGIDAAAYLSGGTFTKAEIVREGEGPGGGVFVTGETTSGARVAIDYLPCSGVNLERATVTAGEQTVLLELPVWESFDSPGRLVHLVRNRVECDVTGDTLGDGSATHETNGFTGENVAFFEAVRAGKPFENDLASVRASMSLAEAVLAGAATWRMQPV